MSRVARDLCASPSAHCSSAYDMTNSCPASSITHPHLDASSALQSLPTQNPLYNNGLMQYSSSASIICLDPQYLSFYGPLSRLCPYVDSAHHRSRPRHWTSTCIGIGLVSGSIISAVSTMNWYCRWHRASNWITVPLTKNRHGKRGGTLCLADWKAPASAGGSSSLLAWASLRTRTM